MKTNDCYSSGGTPADFRMEHRRGVQYCFDIARKYIEDEIDSVYDSSQSDDFKRDCIGSLNMVLYKLSKHLH